MNTISENAVDVCIEKCQATFNSILRNEPAGILVHGMGQFGILSLEYLQENHNICGLVDSDPMRCGGIISGLKVYHPNDYAYLVQRSGAVLITSRHHSNEIKRQLDESIPSMSFEAFYVLNNLDIYKWLRDNIFQDERSKYVLRGLLLAALTGNRSYYALISEADQYFSIPDFSSGLNEIFVNAGAYTGDTIEKFIWSRNGQFKSIYAFEPGERQFAAMEERVRRLISEWAINSNQINLIQGGISSKSERVELYSYGNFHLTEFSFAMMERYDTVGMRPTATMPLYSIDDYFKDLPYNFLIADIEGNELKMLKGAEKSLKKNKPKICICVYHRMTDIIDMVKFIKNLDIGYQFYLRHHTPNACETVLYCQ